MELGCHGRVSWLSLSQAETLGGLSALLSETNASAELRENAPHDGRGGTASCELEAK